MSGGRIGIWIIAAALLVAAAFWLVRGRGSEGSLPVPGEKPPASSPREEITDAERQRLREILEERGPGER